MAASQIQLIEPLKEVGNRLLDPPASTTELVNLLDEVNLILSKVGQAPSPPLQEALLLPMKALIADELFRHSEAVVRITVASCLNEIMRISAPVPPYADDKMKEVFELIVSSFENLSCQLGRCYSKAVSILESLAKLRSCVMMLDLDCDPLITKMFDLFLKNISSKHCNSVFLAMEKIMIDMIQESDSVSLEALKVLMASIKKENQNVSPSSLELGAKVLKECGDKLRPFIMDTVASVGCSLEDYDPILSLICKTEPDAVEQVVHDSSNHLVNNECVQALEAVGHGQNAISSTDLKVGGSKFGGTTSNRESKPNSSDSDEGNGNVSDGGKASLGISRCQPKKSSVESRSENKGRLQKSVGSKRVREEATGINRKQLRHATSHGDCSINKSKPQKNVSGGSGPSGKHLLKQHKDSSDGIGSKKSKLSQSMKDKNKPNDASRNQRKQASSDDDVYETPHGRKNYKEDLVGCRIKVYWPLDDSYYEGRIASYNKSMNKHKVLYDDGDMEVLNLRKERWEFLGDEAPDTVLLTDKPTPHPPSNKQQQEACNEGEKKKSQKHTNRKEVIPNSGGECGDGSFMDTKTVVKSEIPQTSSETKRPRPQQEAYNEGEKKKSQNHSNTKEGTPQSRVESGDGSFRGTKTVVKSEIPETASEATQLRPHQKTYNEGEKETSQKHTNGKEGVPQTGGEPGDGSSKDTKTVVKSEIPETPSEAKRPRLSDGEDS